MSNTTPLIEHVENYIKDGFIVFPVANSFDKTSNKTNKRPLISEWQNITIKDADRMIQAFNHHKANAIGLPTGKTNGVFVLDLDPGADVSGKELPPTPTVKTGRGLHYYYQYDCPYSNTTNEDLHIDTRCDGGFVVLPPSWHFEREYEWVVPLERNLLAPIPQWVRDLVKKSKKPIHEIALGISEGGRNRSASSVIGHVLANLHEELWEDFGWGGLRLWNKRNTPPLHEEELYKVFISIASREKMKREGLNVKRKI